MMRLRLQMLMSVALETTNVIRRGRIGRPLEKSSETHATVWLPHRHRRAVSGLHCANIAPEPAVASEHLPAACLITRHRPQRLFGTNAVKHFKFEPRGKRRLHKKPNAYGLSVPQHRLSRPMSRSL
jgi:hypothetical protein